MHPILLTDRSTDDDELLTFRLGEIDFNSEIHYHQFPMIIDMIHSGIMLLARQLAVQYGDGKALTEFYRDSLHVYNRRKKVR